jgi:two-component system, LytTR family, sensor kinase
MRHAVGAWGAVLAGWTGLGLFFAVSTSLTYSSMGRPATWGLTMARSLSEWWLWALLTPLVVWLARRFPVQRRTAARNLAVHVAAGAAFAGAKVAADRALYAGLTGFWTYWLASSFALQFCVYALVVAGAHSLEYHRRGREREQLESRLAETRLQLLSLQLQPHFLFNTLNTIAELVHDDPDTADQMIAGLSDLLRRTLELGNVQEIPLRAELDLLALYLDIQKARFGDRLRVNIDVTADAAGRHVPVLLLQPLVENAIKHGLATHLAEGRIDISARCSGGALLIEIADDGTGAAGEPGGRERVGLGNTRARLETLYGSAARIELHREPGRGARVSLTLPTRPSEVAAP